MSVDKQVKVVEPSGPLVLVVMFDGTEEIYTLAEAEALRTQGLLQAKVEDDKALTLTDMYSDDEIH